MTPTERELIRQQLHKTDLLLRQIDRKCISMIEQTGLIQGVILAIEEEKKKIYRLLDKKEQNHEKTT